MACQQKHAASAIGLCADGHVGDKDAQSSWCYFTITHCSLSLFRLLLSSLLASAKCILSAIYSPFFRFCPMLCSKSLSFPSKDFPQELSSPHKLPAQEIQSRFVPHCCTESLERRTCMGCLAPWHEGSALMSSHSNLVLVTPKPCLRAHSLWS